MTRSPVPWRWDVMRVRPGHRLGLILVCLGLVLAGCSRGGGGPDPTTTPDDRFVIVTPTPGTPVPRTPTPVTGDQTYVVQPGDSLSSIASEFGVSQEDLQAANGIDDPNSIFVGQRLVIPDS